MTVAHDDTVPEQVASTLDASAADLRAGRMHNAAEVGREARKMIEEAERRQGLIQVAAPGR